MSHQKDSHLGGLDSTKNIDKEIVSVKCFLWYFGALSSKGQLISECLWGVIDFPKNQQKIWQISAQESKKWSNQQSRDTLL